MIRPYRLDRLSKGLLGLATIARDIILSFLPPTLRRSLLEKPFFVSPDTAILLKSAKLEVPRYFLSKADESKQKK